MRSISLFVVILFLFGCSNNDGNQKDTATIETGDVSEDSVGPLYPFVQYVRDQIAYVDSTPITIEMITEINGIQMDSTLVSKEAFKQLAGAFTEVDPNISELRPLYRETSFEDLTLGTLTFTIKAIDNELPLQQADILLHPETRKVKNIYLKIFGNDGDSVKQQNLLWVHNYRCQMSSIIEPLTGKPYTRTIKLIWDRPLN